MLFLTKVTLDDDQYDHLCVYLANNDPDGSLKEIHGKYMENTCNIHGRMTFSDYLQNDSYFQNEFPQLKGGPPRTLQ